jgi:hypothetical protein
MSLTKCTSISKISAIIPRTTAITSSSYLSCASGTQTVASDMTLKYNVLAVLQIVWCIFLAPGPSESDLRIPECLHPCSFSSVPSVVVSREVLVNLASLQPSTFPAASRRDSVSLCLGGACHSYRTEGVFNRRLMNDGVDPAEIRGRSPVSHVRDRST